MGKKLKVVEETASQQTSKQDVQQLTEEAVKEILAGISAKDAQKDGLAFIPDKWHERYKGVLGPYKKFILAQSDKLAIVEDGTRFVIKKAGDADPALARKSTAKAHPWLNDLEKAWHIYNIVTKKEDRNIDGFVGVLPDAAKYIKGGGAV